MPAETEIDAFQAGREARRAGVPRSRRRNPHWLRGWDCEQQDIEQMEEQK